MSLGEERSVTDLLGPAWATRRGGSLETASAPVAKEGLRDLDARGGGKRRREREREREVG